MSPTATGPTLRVLSWIRPHTAALVSSESRPGLVHTTDLAAGSCSCEARQFFPLLPCKHLLFVAEEAAAAFFAAIAPVEPTPITKTTYRVARAPRAPRPSCHCVRCGERYTFTEASPLLCPKCVAVPLARAS